MWKTSAINNNYSHDFNAAFSLTLKNCEPGISAQKCYYDVLHFTSQTYHDYSSQNGLLKRLTKTAYEFNVLKEQ